MNKLRNGLIILAIIVIIGQLILMDYTNFGFKENGGNYLGIFSMVLLIIAMISSNRYDKRTTGNNGA